MADTFTEKVIEDGPRNLVKSFAYTYVDTGQSAVLAVDVSTLSALQDGTACSNLRIKKVWFSTIGLSLKILWDASTDTLAVELPSGYQGDFDFSSFGGLVNSASSPTGDLRFTTVGHGAGDTYTVVLECIKEY
jgi:hypothetical protein|tara:strand:+ start:1927 stop:2325 length:399 start_codon:yes stop_codon:yes gene_type:complete